LKLRQLPDIFAGDHYTLLVVRKWVRQTACRRDGCRSNQSVPVFRSILL
jgi:hypothetical protein